MWPTCFAEVLVATGSSFAVAHALANSWSWMAYLPSLRPARGC
jgi:hypothetical protein